MNGFNLNIPSCNRQSQRSCRSQSSPLSEAQRTATLFHEQELVAVFKSSADDLSQVGGESGASKSVNIVLFTDLFTYHTCMVSSTS